MKKYFISLLMMAVPVTIMAQFQVLSDGRPNSYARNRQVIHTLALAHVMIVLASLVIRRQYI